jgi:hypothetical protein
MDNILHVGDTVLWKGGFGLDPAREVIVEGIELITEAGSKYGTPVQAAQWSHLTGRHAVISLKNQHWAYGCQISPLTCQEDESEDCRGHHRDSGRGVCVDCGTFLER